MRLGKPHAEEFEFLPVDFHAEESSSCSNGWREFHHVYESSTDLGPPDVAARRYGASSIHSPRPSDQPEAVTSGLCHFGHASQGSRLQRLNTIRAGLAIRLAKARHPPAQASMPP